MKILRIIQTLLLCCCSLLLLAASQGPNNPSAATGAHWTNPSYIYSSNDAYTIYNRTAQEYLISSSNGFAIPTGSFINGIEIQIEGHGVSDGQSNIEVALSKNKTSPIGNSVTDILKLTTDSIATFGGPSDLWGASWTASEINSNNFGIMVRDKDAIAGELDIDWENIKVFYTDPKDRRRHIASPGGLND